jgi:hypothetical protein
MLTHQGGQNICGATIGVLCLESYFPKPPGHIKNPSSLPFRSALAASARRSVNNQTANRCGERPNFSR